MNNRNKPISWSWVPSLYYAEGLPYAFVMIVSVVMYKKLNISNTEIALYTSWLYLPWVIKPLWSPFIEIFKTKRFWIIFMQLLIGAGLAGIALTIPSSNMFQYTLVLFWLIAFSSSTHDIAADGFYMLGLSSHDQAWFIGIRNTFYRFAILTGQGLLVILAGQLENIYDNVAFAWAIVFGGLSSRRGNQSSQALNIGGISDSLGSFLYPIVYRSIIILLNDNLHFEYLVTNRYLNMLICMEK